MVGGGVGWYAKQGTHWEKLREHRNSGQFWEWTKWKSYCEPPNAPPILGDPHYYVLFLPEQMSLNSWYTCKLYSTSLSAPIDDAFSHAWLLSQVMHAELSNSILSFRSMLPVFSFPVALQKKSMWADYFLCLTMEQNDFSCWNEMTVEHEATEE